MLEALSQVVRDNGGRMTFDDFRTAAQSAGVNPSLWLKAKHKGLVTTQIAEDGVLYIAVPAQEVA